MIFAFRTGINQYVAAAIPSLKRILADLDAGDFLFPHRRSQKPVAIAIPKHQIFLCFGNTGMPVRDKPYHEKPQNRQQRRRTQK